MSQNLPPELFYKAFFDSIVDLFIERNQMQYLMFGEAVTFVSLEEIKDMFMSELKQMGKVVKNEPANAG